MEEAQSICKEKKQDEAEPCALLKGLKRTTEQLSRKFLEGVGTKRPDDLLHASCAFCGHQSVDDPPENVGVAETSGNGSNLLLFIFYIIYIIVCHYFIVRCNYGLYHSFLDYITHVSLK